MDDEHEVYGGDIPEEYGEGDTMDHDLYEEYGQRDQENDSQPGQNTSAATVSLTSLLWPHNKFHSLDLF